MLFNNAPDVFLSSYGLTGQLSPFLDILKTTTPNSMTLREVLQHEIGLGRESDAQVLLASIQNWEEEVFGYVELHIEQVVPFS